MINSSSIGCRYWDETNLLWSDNGCSYVSVDNTHIKCSCNHLTAVAPQFVTPSDDLTNADTSTKN